MSVPTPTSEEIKEFEEALIEVRAVQEQKIKARELGKTIEEEYQFKITSMKQTDKQMFILFAMDGCPSCKILKHLITYNEDVIEALKPYETMIINVSQIDTHLIKKMNVYSFPGYFVIDKDEKVLKKNYGCNVLHDPVLPLVTWINMQVG
jgi:thiol:disulfide interchange protein